MNCPSQETLDRIFPPERTDAFFDALYGGAEEGAYDIRLVCRNVNETSANLAFELVRRPGKCLKCSLTYGLPGVFQRHPVLDVAGVAKAVASEVGLGEDVKWEIAPVREIDENLHIIPFTITKA